MAFKKLVLITSILFSITAVAQKKSKTKAKKQVTTVVSDSIPTPPKPATKYTDNVDDRMKGPNGEKIFIGPNGGRYYLKDNKKIYVPYGVKKKKG